MCSATKARLPDEFLDTWGIIRRDDGGLWVLPIGVMGDEMNGSRTDPCIPHQYKKTPPLTFRLVNRLLLIQELTGSFCLHHVAGGRRKKRQRRRRSPVKLMFAPRWWHPYGPIGRIEEDTLVWREDMSAFFLDHVRRDLVRRVMKASDFVKGSNVKRCVWTELPSSFSGSSIEEALKQVQPFDRIECGVVMVLSSDGSNSSLGKSSSIASRFSSFLARLWLPYARRKTHFSSSITVSSIFPDFVTLPHTQSKVPVIDLSVLLSPVELDQLRNHHPRFTKSMLFLRPDDPVTVDAVLALWRFKGLFMYDVP